MKYVDEAMFGHVCRQAGVFDAGKSVVGVCDVLDLKVLHGLGIKGEKLPPAIKRGIVGVAAHGALDRNDAVDNLESRASPMAAGTVPPIVVAVVGETHNDADDLKRAREMIRRFVGQKHTNHALIYFERGLKARHANLLLQPKGAIVADEQVILGADGHETTRSAIAAAYCVASLAGGDQSRKARVLMLMGQNHVDDVVLAFRYLIEKKATFPWLAYRPQGYHTLKTQAL